MIEQNDANEMMFRACAIKDIKMLRAALSDGADITAYEESRQLEAGKTAMHISAKRGFVEGVALLRSQGLDVDCPDEKMKNSALLLMPNVGNADMFQLLIEMGADPQYKNASGYTPQHAAQSMDKAHGKNRFDAIVQHFESLPARENMEGLTLQEALARNSQGYCMLDNPKMLVRLEEMGAALAANGTPLSLEALEQPSKDGRSYLEKVMIRGATAQLVSCLNAQGTQVQHDALFNSDKQLTAFGEQLTQWGQVAAVFDVDNWRGANSSVMVNAYKTLPKEAQQQVLNLHQTKAQLDAVHGRGVGRYVK